MGSKFFNKRCEFDGIKFDSQKEMKYYRDNLKPMLQARKIRILKVHPTYTLQEGFKRQGIAHRAITYEADVGFIGSDEQKVIVDVKASPKFLHPVYKLKKKLFLKQLPERDIFIEVF